MITHEAFAQEFLKLAEGRVVEVPLTMTPDGMPFPERPGKRYVARYLTDPVLVAAGTAVGAGLGQLAASRIKGLQATGTKGKLLDAAKVAIPVISGAGASLLTTIINEKRKQRLMEAIEADTQAQLKRERAARQ